MIGGSSCVLAKPLFTATIQRSLLTQQLIVAAGSHPPEDVSPSLQSLSNPILQMRLLERNSTGEFILTTDFVDDEVSPYAILSHTWGADTEEVSFEDLTNGTGQDKAGYEKLRFCGDRAAEDNLQYF